MLPHQLFLGLEPGLVIHLIRTLDPVPQIDMGKTQSFRSCQGIKDHEGAQAAGVFTGAEKRIDHRQAVLQPVDEDGGDKLSAIVLKGQSGHFPPVFDDRAVDLAFLQHLRKIEQGHVRHAAIGMALFYVFAEDFILLRRCRRLDLADNKVRIEPHNAPKAGSGMKFSRQNPN